MHKPLKSFYNYLAKAFDKKTDKMDAKRKKREAELAEIYPPEYYEWDEEICKRWNLPPPDAKNPYRFL